MTTRTLALLVALGAGIVIVVVMCEGILVAK
jgi:hypothetical protein